MLSIKDYKHYTDEYELEEVLKKLKKKDVEVLVKELYLPVYMYNKSQMIEKIIFHLIGLKKQHEAIMSINLK